MWWEQQVDNMLCCISNNIDRVEDVEPIRPSRALWAERARRVDTGVVARSDPACASTPGFLY
jgi:hypothetical protein